LSLPGTKGIAEAWFFLDVSLVGRLRFLTYILSSQYEAELTLRDCLSNKYAYSIFFRENAKDIAFHFIEQEERGTGTTSRRRDTRTHTRPSSPEGEEVPHRP
jgi:hypothetical protein